jgi:Protein of unknown function (DUF3017)
MPANKSSRTDWLHDQAPFTLVALLMVLSVLYLLIWPDHWRRGVGIIAFAMFVAGVLRVVLPTQRIGMLAVRARWFDAVCYFALGVVIIGVSLRLQ